MRARRTAAPLVVHPQVYTVQEAATMLRIGRDACYALVKEGALRSFKRGRAYYISMQAIHDFIAERERQAVG